MGIRSLLLKSVILFTLLWWVAGITAFYFSSPQDTVDYFAHTNSSLISGWIETGILLDPGGNVHLKNSVGMIALWLVVNACVCMVVGLFTIIVHYSRFKPVKGLQRWRGVSISSGVLPVPEFAWRPARIEIDNSTFEKPLENYLAAVVGILAENQDGSRSDIIEEIRLMTNSTLENDSVDNKPLFIVCVISQLLDTMEVNGRFDRGEKILGKMEAWWNLPENTRLIILAVLTYSKNVKAVPEKIIGLEKEDRQVVLNILQVSSLLRKTGNSEIDREENEIVAVIEARFGSKSRGRKHNRYNQVSNNAMNGILKKPALPTDKVQMDIPGLFAPRQ